MTFIELGIQGLCLIEPTVHGDDRGSFRRHFCAEEYAKQGLDPAVVQGNISENVHAGTLRGLHYQVAPFAEAKTLSCLTGAIHVITLDLRLRSRTFLRWVSADLTADNRRGLFVPTGCANGWITLAPHTTVHYYMSERFDQDSARGVRYNDPRFEFRWPREPSVISERDRSFPDFDPAAVQSFQRPAGDGRRA